MARHASRRQEKTPSEPAVGMTRSLPPPRRHVVGLIVTSSLLLLWLIYLTYTAFRVGFA